MLAGLASPLAAQGLADKAKQTGCTDTPRLHPSDSGTLYKCTTEFGTGFFSLDSPGARRGAQGSRANSATPANFPRVDSSTQRNRDSDRRRILEQELGSEERMLTDTRRQLEAQQGLLAPDGKAPSAERLALQKQVQLHENNIANLRKELANLK